MEDPGYDILCANDILHACFPLYHTAGTVVQGMIGFGTDHAGNAKTEKTIGRSLAGRGDTPRTPCLPLTGSRRTGWTDSPFKTRHRASSFRAAAGRFRGHPVRSSSLSLILAIARRDLPFESVQPSLKTTRRPEGRLLFFVGLDGFGLRASASCLRPPARLVR